jgi:hypothetical protein
MSHYVIRHGRRIELETVDTGVAPKRKQRTNHYIGCPLGWLKRVLPLVKSKEQLAVAIWLHRRRAVCRSEVFTVPNQELLAELGINRRTKYRTLRWLESAGAIALTRNDKHALQVRMLW